MPRKYHVSEAVIEQRKLAGKARQESMSESERVEFASDGAATRWMQAKRRKRKPRPKSAAA